MNTTDSMNDDLQAHLEVCLELLALVQSEGEALRAGDVSRQSRFYEARKTISTRLGESLDRIRVHRARWSEMSQRERAEFPDVPQALRQNQDLIMRIIVLDRENEQLLLRHGLAPARSLPSANRQRPGYVAGLYRGAAA
jgi:hypothetical protein